jgi:CrcB protein
MIIGIAVGGVLGTLARYGLYCWVYSHWTTWGINLVACSLIGCLYGLSESINTPTIAWLSIGFLGAFSTFSTFSKDSLVLIHAGAYGTALLYMMGNVFGGILATALGYWIVK